MPIIEKKLIMPQLQCTSDLDALDQMSDMLYDRGYVKDTFKESIRKREIDYPTGIRVSSDVSVAIPHANLCDVRKTGVCIGLLKHPVSFALMGNKSERVDVKVIVMLAINDSKQHMEYLAKIMTIFSDADLLKKLCQCQNADQAFSMLSYLND